MTAFTLSYCMAADSKKVSFPKEQDDHTHNQAKMVSIKISISIVLCAGKFWVIVC